MFQRSHKIFMARQKSTLGPAALSSSLQSVHTGQEKAVHLHYESYCALGLLVNYLKEVDGDVAEVHRELEKEAR